MMKDVTAYRVILDKEGIDEIRQKRSKRTGSKDSYMWEEYEITPNNALQYRKEEMNDRHVMKQTDP